MWKPLLCLLAGVGGLLTPARAQTAPAELQTLEFVENLGQWPAPVRYCAEIPGGRLFMEPHGLTYSLLARRPDFHGGRQQAATAEIPAHGLRVSFEGSADQPALSSADQTTEVRNYLRGNDPKQWAHGVRGFRQLRYGQLWPGIGAHFYENRDQQLEYDFELAAHADPAAIRLRYDGADALTLTAEGVLEVRTSVGVLRELAPRAWQTDPAGHRRPVPCAYVLHDRTVTFQLGAYNPGQPLTIDPTVVFSSFTGSAANNLGYTATYDQQGNLYSGSIAFSAGYPTTSGAFMTSFGGLIDIAIIKFNTATTGPAARAWATYLGGFDAEFPHSLVVGSQGDLFVLGTTSSTNYPTSPSAYDRTFNGGTFVSPFGFLPLQNGSDLVVTRLSANGSTLVGSTFLGGTGNDGLMDPSLTPLVRNWGDAFRGDLLLDANDNIYVASNTTSANFPTTNGLGGAFRGGNYDAVVCKLSPTASSLLWSSFLGGSSADAAYSLQLDATGNVYVAGGTTSPNFPTTAGTLLPTAPGGVDGFVARLSRTGTVLEKATYLGTSAYDQGYFLQLDTNGAVYILGQTLGAYPVTPGRYQNPNGRQFIHKLDAGLATTGFSTVFGSGGSQLDISPTAFLVDQCNRIYVSGWGGGENRTPPFSNGGTTGLPVTPNAFQKTTDGQDFYLMQLSPEALTLDYATYFGQNGGLGDHVDGGTSRFDPRGIVYQAVCICQATAGAFGFPIPPGAGTYSATSGFPSICNNAAFKLNFETTTVVAGSDRSVCLGSPPQLLTGTPGGGTWTGPGVSGSVATGFYFTPTAALVGVQTLTYTVSGVGPCGGVSTLRITVSTSPTAAFVPPAQTAFCLGTSALPLVPLAATPAGGTFSGPGVSGNVFNPNTAGPGTHTITYTVAAGACTLQTTLVLTVTRASVGANFTVCSNSLVPTPLTGTPAGGTWTGPGVSGSVATGFFFTPTAALVGSRVLTYSVTNGSGCTSTAALTATVLAGPVYVPPTLPAYCVSGPTVVLPAGAIWSGRGVQGPGSNNVYTFSPTLAGAGSFTIAYRTGFNFCDAVGSVPVTVTTPALISLTADTVLCPGSTQPFRVRALPAGGSWSGPYVTSAGVFTPPAGLTGTTTLTYTLNAVCVSTATRRVSVAVAPTYAARWDAAQCAATRQAPLIVRFSDPLNPDPGVRWDFGDGSQGAGNPATHVYAQAGRYAPKIIRAYNNGQCFLQLDLPVVEVTPPYQIPNIITPNGDSDNEYFRATNGCPARLQIFSRWGTKVFEAEYYQNDWNGGQLPNGVYYYHLRQPDGTTTKGWVEISR